MALSTPFPDPTSGEVAETAPASRRERARARAGESWKVERRKILQSAAGDARLQADIDRLVDGRARDVRLTGELRTFYNRYSWEGRAKAARGWLIAVTIIDPVVVFVDLVFDPDLFWPALALRVVWIPIMCVLSLQAWRKPVPAWREGVSILVFVSALMILAGILGSLIGGTIYERYVSACFFVVATSIAIIPLESRWTVALAVVSASLYLGFQLSNSLVGPLVASLSTVFFGVVLSALVLARHITTITHQRSVLMRLRDAYQAARLAEANIELSRLATTDGLTGLLNRRSINEALDKAFQQSESVSVALLDIDHFKMINDTLGHSEGDRCLKLVAETLAGGIRADCDHVGRFGGEEFLLVMPGTDAFGAALAVERLRSAVEGLRLHNPGASCSPWVTVSVGIATTSPANRAPDVACLLRMADEALYEAKRGGRNRVRSYEAVAWRETQEARPLSA